MRIPKKLPSYRVPPPILLGSLFGLLTSVSVGLVYIVLLQEPGSAFYTFALLGLCGAPLLAGILTYQRMWERRIGAAFTAMGIVFGITLALFIFIYGFYTRIETRRVQIPALCDGTYAMSMLPVDRSYTLQNGTSGIRLLSDAQITVVAVVDQTRQARPTTLFLVNTKDKSTIGSIAFPNDIVAAASDTSTVYLLYDGLGHLIHKETGVYESYFLTIDSYGTNSDGFFETTGTYSSWSRDGNVKLRSRLIFNGIAQGCYIDGVQQSVTKL